MAKIISKVQNEVITEDDIEQCRKEYIEHLPDPEDIKNNRMLFTDMLKYINKRLFKTEVKQLYNRKSNIDTDDIDLLNKYWDKYTSLCYRFNRLPTLIGFSVMTGVSMDTFNTWKNGDVRGGPTSQHSESVKKWLKECELALVNNVGETNSVGSMFLLKANYDYVEASRSVEPVSRALPGMTVDEIASKRGVDLLPEPEKPVFDD